MIVHYTDPERVFMAETHHYAIGRKRLASGYEDPILLWDGSEVVDRRHKDGEECPECATWKPLAEQSRQLLPEPDLWKPAPPTAKSMRPIRRRR